MTPDEILKKAIEAVTGRMENHGSPRDTFVDIAARWTATIGVPVTAHQVALCLIDLKIVRANNNPQHIDNAVDIAGYASLLGELAGQTKAYDKGTVPLVCDFLQAGLVKKGDVLIDNKGRMDVYRERRHHLYYPNDAARETWSVSGWKFLISEGKQKARHIVRIERDGVVVAEGQRYYD